jgi:hypothetical protein
MKNKFLILLIIYVLTISSKAEIPVNIISMTVCIGKLVQYQDPLCSTGIVTRPVLTTGESGFNLMAGAVSALRPTQSPIQWILGVLSPGVN